MGTLSAWLGTKLGGWTGLAVLGVALVTPGCAAAQIRLNDAFPGMVPGADTLGPGRAKGAVVWSHGRSIDTEDSTVPSPLYLKAFRDAGWDVFRLDRMRISDTLPASAGALADRAAELKSRGYRRVVATGQSFGAFLSLIAAGQSDAIDAIIGTAPAAYGSFSESYDSWQENAQQLYPILRRVRSARVMLFYFHGDDFDPGGRGEQSRTILAGRGLDHQVIDQPANLMGHGAANTGLFVRRFSACMVRFAEAPLKPGGPPCDEAWGRTPSASLLQVSHAAAAGTAAGPATAPPDLRPFVGSWWGTYMNGREVLLSVTGGATTGTQAEYVLGPGVEADQPLERVHRTGRLDGDDLVFDEKGRSILRYRLRPDGKLAATWIARDGHARLETVLKRVD
jgi:hypothetical protein